MLTTEENMEVVLKIVITLTTSRRAYDFLGLKPNTSKREVSKNTQKENALPWVELVIS